jgi:FUS-interacting serine-arginine-rich protein 1
LSLERPANTSLFVRNVSDRTSMDELRDLFRKYGKLFDVYIPKDFYSRRPRGFAYVQFEYPEDAAEAQKTLQHTPLHGRQLEASFELK